MPEDYVTPDDYARPRYERGVVSGEPRCAQWLTQNGLWLTAMHEAAHAVIAYRNGLTVTEIRLRYDRAADSRGYVKIPGEQRDVSHAREMIAVYLAGNIAGNVEARAATWHRYGRDEKKAIGIIFRLLLDGDEDYYDLDDETQMRIALTYRDECFRMTIRAVTEPATWRMIRSLARTIHRSRVLRGTRLRATLHRLASASRTNEGRTGTSGSNRSKRVTPGTARSVPCPPSVRRCPSPKRPSEMRSGRGT